VAEPDAEISDNFNFGITGDLRGVLGGNVLLTLDAFQIDIDDRIAITDRILTSAFPTVQRCFPRRPRSASSPIRSTPARAASTW
jgi:iron complex outermembrane recepter protein